MTIGSQYQTTTDANGQYTNAAEPGIRVLIALKKQNTDGVRLVLKRVLKPLDSKEGFVPVIDLEPSLNPVQ